MKEERSEKIVTTYRCPLCHSTDVLMKMWENPNTPDISFNLSCDEDDIANGYCNRCQVHLALETIPATPSAKTQTDSDHIWYCKQCGGTNVEIRQWIDPNNNDKPTPDDGLYFEDCRCWGCEGNTNLEFCLPSEYDRIAADIKKSNNK